MVAAQAPAAATGPSRPPASIEDFLWNIHSVLVATPGPLQLDHLKDAYSKHLGHKCAVERFLVVGEGGLAATLKRIPHIVTLYQDAGTTCVKATQGVESTKQDLVEVDQSYRRELVKKNQQAKAQMGAGAKAKAKTAAAPAAPAAAAKAPAAAPPAAPAASPPAKRPAEEAAGQEAKKAKAAGGAPAADGDIETLARMLVQGVVRVLQNRAKAGKGPLPIDELEKEFQALWKVPFNLQQAGETDAVTFLQKWPNKVEVSEDSDGKQQVQLKKVTPGAGGTPAAAKAATPATAAKAAAPATTTANTKVAPQPTPGVAPQAPAAAAAPAKAPEEAANGEVPKRSGGPSRPPASIEDFLWNIHAVLESSPTQLPIDSLKDAYSKHLGHKCAIERFLVVGEGGLAATLKRIPHVVTLVPGKDGAMYMKPTQPVGTTREGLVQADQAYRRQLHAKNAAAKAAAGTPKAATPAAAPAATPAPAAPAATTPAAKAPAAAAPAAVPQKTKADEAAGADAKKPKTGDDQETLSKMLIQGIVRVLQNRVKEGKGPLPIASLEEEFMALWKVPFNLAQAGETDTATFLQKWPKKVEVIGNQVQLADKAAGKAAPPAPGAASPSPEAAAVPVAPKAVAAPTPAAAAAGGAVASAGTASDSTVSEKADGATLDEVPRTLEEIRRQAADQLQAMREMLRKQEVLVSALDKLS